MKNILNELKHDVTLYDKWERKLRNTAIAAIVTAVEKYGTIEGIWENNIYITAPKEDGMLTGCTYSRVLSVSLQGELISVQTSVGEVMEQDLYTEELYQIAKALWETHIPHLEAEKEKNDTQ